MTCARCGKANREGARFCDGCGTALAAKLGSVEARKTVTIVFADLIGSTSLHERLDPESVRRVMDHYYRAVRAPIEAHGGTIVQLLGDGVMCAFGVPLVAEDDAIRAVRAAVAVQEAFREFARQEQDVVGDVGLRVAVNTGEVVVTDEHAAGIGDPLNVAARLQQEARDGDVLIGESTERLVRDVVTLEPVGIVSLRGRAETVRAFRVLSLERPTGAATVAFVGRDDELRRLLAVYESVVRAPGTRLATILGSPGVGKSRLLAEIARRLGARAKMLSARCDAAGGGTFAPMADALRDHLRLADGAGPDALRAAVEALLPGEESSRIATGIAALLAGTPAPPEETFFVVRRLLAAVAATQPVVLVIDDVQWAEPLLLDLIEHLVQWGAGTPLLVLVAARPELRDARASLATQGDLVAAVVTLAGLDAGAATRLAANVIGAEELPAAIAGRVLATSEGNPLFVGELVRMLVHDGILRREGDRWTTGADLATFEMPPTIHALLAARIERLKPAERTVLERAAVVGRHFSRGAVANLLPPDITDLDARLETLRRSELIEPDTGWLLGEPVMRFHHVLIRDAAYRRVLKGTRAELHARFADWLESRSGGAVEHDETLGWHLEQAHQNLRELGPVDAKGRVLGERAARHLGAAGRRALARDDLPLAASLLGRAIARLDPDDPARSDLALDWCEALLASGDVGPAAAAIDEVGRLSAGSDRLRAWHTCFAGQLAALTDPRTLRPTADTAAAAAETLAAAGDAVGEAKAYSVQATALGRLGKFGAAEAALDRALAAARRARDRRRANAVLAGAPLAALWGPSPVTRASGRCLDVVRVLRITQGAPAVEAVALRCQAVLEALRGRTDAARRMIAASRRMVEELGITQRLLEADMFAGIIELLEGDAAAAERLLRDAHAGFRRQGLGIDAAQAAALLGRALLASGRAADAEAISHESEALAGDDLQSAIAWRGVRAEALAQRGEHADAVTLARAAVDIAAATDALLSHADARLALAAALRAAGRASEAAAEELRAIELWEAKGATLLAERAGRGAAPAVKVANGAVPEDPSARVRRRVRPNAATANAERMEAAIAAGDPEATIGVLAEEVEIVHHPTGVTYGREGAVASLRLMLQGQGVRLAFEPLATLGEGLAVLRAEWTQSEIRSTDFAPFGPIQVDTVMLFEVDARGLRYRTEFFAEDKLADAVARLYERHADLLPDGPARQRALSTARSIATLLGPFVAEDVDTRIDDVLALRSDALLVCRIGTGGDRASVGTSGQSQIALWTFGPDGSIARAEQFDVDRSDEALARFADLVAAPSGPRFANVAARAFDQFRNRWLARDWDAVVASTAPNPTMDDRRRLMRLRVFGEDYFRHARIMFASTYTAIEGKLLATRGDRLALFHVHMESDTRGVEAEENFLAVLEVDAQGRRDLFVVLDENDRDAAYDELDTLYAAGEGAPHAEVLANLRAFRVASEARDWDAVARLLPADFTLRSHRRLVGIASVIDRDEYLATRDRLQDLRLQGRMRVDHALRLGRKAGADVMTWYGTIDGGEFEDQFVHVYDHDGRRAHHAEIFDVDQLDAALARYEELEGAQLDEARARFAEVRAGTPRDPVATLLPPNAACVAIERARAAFQARDWDMLRGMYHPDAKLADHRRHVLLADTSLDQQIADFMRAARDEAIWETGRLVAAIGERIAVQRFVMRGRMADAPWEIEFLQLCEVDDVGRITGLIAFDADDWRGADSEAWRRWFATDAVAARIGPAVLAFQEALNDRNAPAMRSALSADVVVHDHRRIPVSSMEAGGVDAFMHGLSTLWELASDVQIEIVRGAVTYDDRGIVLVLRTFGTLQEGGPFESYYVIVAAIRGGRIRRFEMFEPEEIDAAMACFAGLPSDPLRIPPNSATRTGGRWQEAFDRRDWEALEQLHAPSMEFHDRRRTIRLSGDREMMLATIRFLGARSSARLERTVLATAGEHLALERRRWIAGAEGSSIEGEFLSVFEVDRDGRYVAIVSFDVDDRRAARREMREGYARHLAARGIPSANHALAEAAAAHDLDAIRAVLPRDFVFHDHRRTGPGRMEGVDEYVGWLRTLFEESPDAVLETLYEVAAARHAILAVSHTFGTLWNGGAFETVYAQLTRFAGDRFVGVELFELDDLDAARARFASLRPDPLRIPPNSATRTSDRWQEAFDRRDWDAVDAQFAASLEYDDRRRVTRLKGDRETLIASTRYVGARGRTRVSRVGLSTAGDRLVLERYRWAGGEADSRFEVEGLCVTEVDAQGRVVAHVVFDLDDRPAASREMLERFLRSDAARVMPPESGEMFRALLDHDVQRARAVLPDGFVLDDHRRTGLGRIEGADAYIAALTALFAEAPNVVVEPLYYLAVEPHGALAVAHTYGTLAGGGEFENVFVQLGRHHANGIISAEMYELDDLDVARARFEALRPKAELIPPNAASRVRRRLHQELAAGAEDAVRALCSPDFVYADRTRRSLVTGGVDEALRSAAYIRSLANVRFEQERIAALSDRILLEHVTVTGGPLGGEGEWELIRLTEIDATDRVRASITFDPEDRRQAFAEAHARFAAGEAAGLAGQAPIVAHWEASLAHDADGMRRWIADDVVVRDHRKPGLFDGLSASEWVESMRVHFELASDVDAEVIGILAVNDCGRVELDRIFGTTADGVAFENVLLRITVTDGAVIRHSEFFDATDRARALARFEQISAASSAARAAG